MFPPSTHSSFLSLHLDYNYFILESKINFKHYEWIIVRWFFQFLGFMMKHWKRDTTLIRLVAPCYEFYILNQPIFGFWELCLSLPGQMSFSEFSIQKLEVLSAKSVLHLLFVTELGPRIVGSYKLWGLQVGPVYILCIFEPLIHINPIRHSGLIGIRFLRIILLPGRRSCVGKWTALVDETRNGSVAPFILYTYFHI